jgi:RHS repeat-associated protein
MTAEKWLTSGDPVPSIAISTTTQGGPSSEVQRVGFTADMMISSGTFTLSFGGQTTGTIAYDASAATVQTALQGLSTIGSGNVVATKTQSTMTAQEWQVTFQGSLAGTNQNQITINAGSVTAMMTRTDIQTTDIEGGTGSNNEVQVVTLSNATGGEFRLAFAGQTTAPIAYNASAATVDSAVEALQSVDTVTTSGSNGGPWTITFTGSHANTNVAQLQGDAANSSSGSMARTISFTYDAASQMTAASDSDGSLAFAYDYTGRVTSETQTITGLTPTVVLATTYDANSNRTALATTLGSNADFKNTYVYDNLNRMTRVTQASNGGNTVATKRVDFAYNALGQFTTIDRYQNTGGTNIVAQTTFAYDTLNRLTDLDHKQSSTTLAGYDYTYDRMNRLATITGTVEGLSTFTHDKTSQLTGGDHASGGAPDETYTYNANGSRTMSGYTTTTNNLTTSDGTYNYTYDDEGNRTRKTTISGGAYEDYTWDHRNRLTKITFKTSGGTVTKTVEHQYDIANRWTRRHTDPDGPGGAAARDNFFAYDGIQPILQLDGAADTDLTNRYLWGPAVDQILADEQPTSLSSAGNIIWPLTDHLGTARDLADQNEFTYTTTVTNHRTYNAFGKLTAETNSAVDSDPSYTGKSTDSDTNLQNNLNRWYDAVLGKWLNEDPTGFRANDTNLARSVHNSPLMNVDPSGLQGVGAAPNDGSGGSNPGGSGLQASYGECGFFEQYSPRDALVAQMGSASAGSTPWGTIMLGGGFDFGFLLGAGASFQFTVSPADTWADTRFGYVVNGGFGFYFGFGASVEGIASVTQAPSPETLNGLSWLYNVSGGVPFSGGFGFSNLVDPLSIGNWVGAVPMVFNCQLGIGGPFPLCAQLFYGGTWGSSISPNEMSEILTETMTPTYSDPRLPDHGWSTVFGGPGM